MPVQRIIHYKHSQWWGLRVLLSDLRSTPFGLWGSWSSRRQPVHTRREHELHTSSCSEVSARTDLCITMQKRTAYDGCGGHVSEKLHFPLFPLRRTWCVFRKLFVQWLSSVSSKWTLLHATITGHKLFCSSITLLCKQNLICRTLQRGSRSPGATEKTAIEYV